MYACMHVCMYVYHTKYVYIYIYIYGVCISHDQNRMKPPLNAWLPPPCSASPGRWPSRFSTANTIATKAWPGPSMVIYDVNPH